ncbi:MAG: hypothetical protein ACKVYV_02965 [Limisphaerales bacterium]
MTYLRLLAAAFATLGAGAATPPVEKLLPTNTLAVVTTASFAAARQAWGTQAWARLWADPAMTEFRVHAESRFRTNVIEALAGVLGVNPRELAALTDGQLAVAVVAGADGPVPLLLADTGTHAARLGPLLDAARANWLTAGRMVETNAAGSKVTWSVAFPRSDFGRIGAFLRGTNTPAATTGTNLFRLTLGQADGLLVAGGDTTVAAGVLARLADGGAALAEVPAWQADTALLPAGESWRGWVNAPLMLKALWPPAPEEGRRRSARPDAARLVSALGLDAVHSLGFGVELSPAGPALRLAIRIPPDARRGLFRMLAFEARDAAPPDAVPADVLEFSRWRFNGARAWDALEQTLTAVSPEIAGVFQLFFSALVDDADPQFDFRRSLVGGLGDDFASWRVATGTNGGTASVALLGSTNAPQLARALRLAAGLLPGGEDAPALTSREEAGVRVFSVTLPALLGGEDEEAPVIHFAAPDTNRLVLSGEASLLEAALATNRPAARLAAALPADAVVRAGGTGGGLFSYENQRETARRFFSGVRNGDGDGALPGALQPLAAARMAGRAVPEPGQWFDLRLLPPFEAVEKHFGLQVSAGAVTTNGWEMRIVQPAP